MPELNFAVEGARPLDNSAVPMLALNLRINGQQTDAVQNVLLQAQIQIETPRRQYSPEEQPQLIELFGTPDRWGETLRSMHWTKVSTLVPAFHDHAVVDLHVPCTFDFNVAATKYFYALEQGEIPLLLLFSGTIFYREPNGNLQVEQIPWSREARYRLPVSVWKQMMDVYYPNSAWLCLRQDIFDRLYAFKCHSGLLTWEQTMDRLLTESAKEVAS